jgi:hypothetical protein
MPQASSATSPRESTSKRKLGSGDTTSFGEVFALNNSSLGPSRSAVSQGHGIELLGCCECRDLL